jgi:hypothetical protein
MRSLRQYVPRICKRAGTRHVELLCLETWESCMAHAATSGAWFRRPGVEITGWSRDCLPGLHPNKPDVQVQIPYYGYVNDSLLGMATGLSLSGFGGMLCTPLEWNCPVPIPANAHGEGFVPISEQGSLTRQGPGPEKFPTISHIK